MAASNSETKCITINKSKLLAAISRASVIVGDEIGSKIKFAVMQSGYISKLSASLGLVLKVLLWMPLKARTKIQIIFGWQAVQADI